MKKINILFIALSFLTLHKTFSQDICDCATDLEYLHQTISEISPAFKKNKKEYQAAYQIALQKINQPNNLFDCHLLMNEMIMSLKDNHMRVFQEKSDTSANYQVKLHRTNMNLETLTAELEKKSFENHEGIYYYKDKQLSIGVRKIENEKLELIILQSKKPLFEEGEILGYLIPHGFKSYKAIMASVSSKTLTSFQEKIEGGIFLGADIQKDPNQANHSKAIHPSKTYHREEIDHKTTYIKAASFLSFYPTLKEAEDFYDQLTGTIDKKNLIVDLRDNHGGGPRNSNLLLKILKDYAKSGNNIYVLTNFNTASNGEIFTERVRKLKNTTVLGHRTNGTVIFEVGNISHHKLPSSSLEATIPFKVHGKNKYLEMNGAVPDIKLDMNTNWIEQVRDIINSKSSI
ncbi:S41 family peptidase [Aureibacter tunicatorum]|uniref:C-terminal processing protease CtpA/Prc n=1 Tax=Aureibacter tunicatorum TaxID=866807 RepID=A0AAE3XMJ5_9BACT|nr:S41 family peptidase [Aureibacter tunicatorum]MDR6240666.1 C-terminal processing protease CtpA/Prc [Aureibacter tunicatorum]BDD07001.1 hypothetical protein AUTU_44840 [Aureibacter tunicatorum]